MRARTHFDIPAQLEEARRHFADWRQGRKGRSRLPKELWALAVKAAARYGLYRTAQTLGIDYGSLKRHVQAAASGNVSGGEAAATFLELTPPRPICSAPAQPAAAGVECILELEDPRGAKMRVHLKGGEHPDLLALTRRFWGGRP